MAAGIFSKSGKVLSPDSKYTGDEPDWYGWEKWPIDVFYKTKRRALSFYNYYMDAASLKPFVLAWAKANGYSKEDLTTLRDAQPYFLPITVGKLIRCLDRGMPPIHPDAAAYYATLPYHDEPPIPVNDLDIIRKGIAEAIVLAKNYASEAAEIISTKAVKPKVNLADKTKEKSSEIMYHLEDLLDRWAANPKIVATLNLSSLLKNLTIQPHACKPIVEWLERYRGEYAETAEKTCPQLAQAYKHFNTPTLRKIVKILDDLISEVNGHAKLKSGLRKTRVKKPKAADKQIARLKFQESSTEYGVDSVSPRSLVGAQRVYLFNTKTRSLAIYDATSQTGFEVKGSTLVGFEKSSFSMGLRKPKEILNGILSATPKKLNTILDGIRTVKRTANGRFNEHTIILRTLNTRP